LTFCTFRRRPYFDDAAAVELVRVEILRTVPEADFELLACCFMPDHLHLLVAGMSPTAALLPFVRLSRQRAATAFRRHALQGLWQPGYFERTLRADDDV